MCSEQVLQGVIASWETWCQGLAVGVTEGGLGRLWGAVPEDFGTAPQTLLRPPSVVLSGRLDTRPPSWQQRPAILAQGTRLA